MSAYPPPTETLPIFNVNEFIGTTSTSQGGGGGGGGGGTFVNYPTAQGALALVGFTNSGTATLAQTSINGVLDMNNNITLAGDLILDGTTANLQYFNGTTQDTAYTGWGTANTYLSADITIDANGKITAISNGGGSSLTPTFESITIEDPLDNTNTSVITQSGSAFSITNNEIASVIELVADTTEVQDLICDSIEYSGDGTTQTSAYTGAGALAGTYTNADITIDADGKITALANGGGGGSLLDENDPIIYPLTLATEQLFPLAINLWSFTKPSNNALTGNFKNLALSYNGQYSIACSYTQGVQFNNSYGNNTTASGSNAYSIFTGGAFANVCGCGMSGNGQYQFWTDGTSVHYSNNFGINVSSTYQTTSLPSPQTANGSNVGGIAVSATGKYVWIYLINLSVLPYIWKSSDFGASFTLVFSNSQQQLFSLADTKIAISASGRYVSYAIQTASTAGSLLVSNDFGITFTSVAVSPFPTGVCMNMAGDIQYVSQYNSASTNYLTSISRNYGVSFTALPASTTSPSQVSPATISCNGTGQYLILGGNSNASAMMSVDYGSTISPFNNASFLSPTRNGKLTANGNLIMGWENRTGTAGISLYNLPYYVPPSQTSLTLPKLAYGGAIIPYGTDLVYSFGFRTVGGYGAMGANESFTMRFSIQINFEPNVAPSSQFRYSNTYTGYAQCFPRRWLNGYGGALTTGTNPPSSSLIDNTFFTTTGYDMTYGAVTTLDNKTEGRALWVYNFDSQGSASNSGYNTINNVGIVCQDSGSDNVLYFKIRNPYAPSFSTGLGNTQVIFSCELLNIQIGHSPTTIETFGLTQNWSFSI
jgi:hypothetical protein